MVIKAGKIYINGDFAENVAVMVDGNVISAVGQFDVSDVISLGELTLLPALIDIHTHGGGGFEVMGTEADRIGKIAEHKLKEGVLSFCPSTVTAGREKTDSAVLAVKNYNYRNFAGAKVLGTFLEGPFISEKYKGAHPSDFIREIDTDELKRLTTLRDGTIKSVAIAPEKQGALEAIKFLAENGVNVRLGHSAATYAQARAGVAAGATIAVHTFNAMSPFTHREAGMVGESLLDNRLYAEVICDGLHISSEAIQILYRLKGADKLILITDSMSAAGMPDGNYKLGELDVSVRDGAARTADGALAGSTLTLNKAVYNLHKLAGVPLCEAVQAATLNPAKALGVDKKIGSISVGKIADMIGVDEEFNVKFVMRDGEIIMSERK